MIPSHRNGFVLNAISPMFEPACLSALTFFFKRQSWQTGYPNNNRVDSDVLPGHVLESDLEFTLTLNHGTVSL